MLDAYYHQYVAMWNEMDVVELHRKQMEKVAFACRYGHISLREALATDRVWLSGFCKALADIVEQENAVSTDG